MLRPAALLCLLASALLCPLTWSRVCVMCTCPMHAPVQGVQSAQRLPDDSQNMRLPPSVWVICHAMAHFAKLQTQPAWSNETNEEAPEETCHAAPNEMTQMSPVPVQMRQGSAQPRRRCASARAMCRVQSWRRCARGTRQLNMDTRISSILAQAPNDRDLELAIAASLGATIKPVGNAGASRDRRRQSEVRSRGSRRRLHGLHLDGPHRRSVMSRAPAASRHVICHFSKPGANGAPSACHAVICPLRALSFDLSATPRATPKNVRCVSDWSRFAASAPTNGRVGGRCLSCPQRL